MLVKHVRDDWKRPFATLVAINTDSGVKIGVAVCHKTNDHFNRKRGTEIALGRAERSGNEVSANVFAGENGIPNRKEQFYVRDGGGYAKRMKLNDIPEYEVVRMKDRAKQYYKPELTVDA